jgi:phage tail-like protein
MSACDVKSKFRFVVRINNIVTAGFRKISGLEMETDVSEFRTGDEPGFCYLPGASKAATVVLERGVLYGGSSSASDLKSWFESVESSTATSTLCGIERPVEIDVLDRDGIGIVRTIRLFDAWPSKFTLGDLDTMESEAWVETLELQTSGIKIAGDKFDRPVGEV